MLLIHRRLTKLVNENCDNWDDLIPGVLFSMRVERQTSTKYSPFEVMFAGRPSRLQNEMEEVYK